MFERYTERARQVVVLGQDEARLLKHNYLGTEHLLLGLLREEEGLAARVLESLDITVEEVRAQVARIVGQGDEVTTHRLRGLPRSDARSPPARQGRSRMTARTKSGRKWPPRQESTPQPAPTLRSLAMTSTPTREPVVTPAQLYMTDFFQTFIEELDGLIVKHFASQRTIKVDQSAGGWYCATIDNGRILFPPTENLDVVIRFVRAFAKKEGVAVDEDSVEFYRMERARLGFSVAVPADNVVPIRAEA